MSTSPKPRREREAEQERIREEIEAAIEDEVEVDDRVLHRLRVRKNELASAPGLTYYARYVVPDDTGAEFENQTIRNLAEARMEVDLSHAGPGVDRVELHPAGSIMGVKLWINQMDNLEKSDLDHALHAAFQDHVENDASRSAEELDLADWEIRCKTERRNR